MSCRRVIRHPPLLLFCLLLLVSLSFLCYSLLSRTSAVAPRNVPVIPVAPLLASVWNVEEDVDPDYIPPTSLPSDKDETHAEVYFLSHAYLDQRSHSARSGVITVMGLRHGGSLLQVSCVSILSSQGHHYMLNDLAMTEEKFYDSRAVKATQWSTRIWRCGPLADLKDFPSMENNISWKLQVRVFSPEAVDAGQETWLTLTRLPPVQPGTHQQYKYNFSLCLAPTFSRLSERDFVYFMEMNTVHGLNHVYVYDFDSGRQNARLKTTWRHYRGHSSVGANASHSSVTSRLTFIPWILPSCLNRNDVYYVGQFLAYQHCLYRAALESQYLWFFDLDELVVPHFNATSKSNHSIVTWSDLMRRLRFHGDDRRCSICFPMHFYVKEDKIPNITATAISVKSKCFQYVNNFYRTYSHPFNYKCIVRPQYVLSMSVHEIASCVPNWKQEKVASNVAAVHHYHETFCLNPKNYPTRWCQVERRDETIRTYERNFRDRLRIAAVSQGMDLPC